MIRIKFITCFLLSIVSTYAFSITLEIGTDPTFLGAPKIDYSYAFFKCVIGDENTGYDSYLSSEFNSFEISTKKENPNLKNNEVQISVSAFSKLRITKSFLSIYNPPRLNPKFANDSRCKNEILMGYQLAGTIRLVRTYFIKETHLNTLVFELEGIKDLSSFYDYVPSSSLNNEITGTGLGIISDSQIDIKRLLNSDNKELFLKSAEEALKQLNLIYNNYEKILSLKLRNDNLSNIRLSKWN